MKDVWIAFGLTVLAGMATGIGSVIAFSAKRTNYRFLSIATGFSAGVMLYVSFVEIFAKGLESLAPRYGDYLAHWINAASFFGGMLLIGLIDNLIPAAENPHETHSEAECMPLHNSSAPIPNFNNCTASASETPEGFHDHSAHHVKLMRMGLFTALAIGIHNFPERLATFSQLCRIQALALPLPWPLRCTIFLRESAYPSPFFTQRATARRLFSTRC